MRWTAKQSVLLAIGAIIAAAAFLTSAGGEAGAQPPQQVEPFLTTTPTPNAGLIAGTVTDGGNGLPASGVEVCAISLPHTSCVTTYSSGRYVISPLPSGNFRVQFSAPGRFVEQCWQSTSCDDPTWLGIASIDDFENINAVMQPPPGTPPTPTPTNTPTPTPPITPTITPTPTLAPTPTLTPTATPTSLPIDATMTPVPPTPTPPLGDFEAAMSGRITVLSNGEPVFGASVCAQRSFPSFERCAFSAQDGSYTIRGLQPGNYTVTVSDPSRRFTDNCYGTLSCDSPQRIGVARNEIVSFIDMAMDAVFSASFPTPTATTAAPSGSVSGRLTVDGVPVGGEFVCVVRLPVSDVSACGTTDDDGNYEIPGLPTGNYEVSFQPGAVGDDLWCYRDALFCQDATPVGVVDGLARTGIDLRVDSTVDPDIRPEPTPTSLPGTPVPTPEPTVTPTGEDETIPYSEFDRSGPWVDVPHIGTLGVGTYGTGTYPFGSRIEPVIDLMTAYFGPPSGRQGRVDWWGPNEATPLARIERDGAHRLVAASINLEENARLGLEPVFLGDVWLFSGNFPLDAFGLDTDRFIYLEDDAAGNAVRCASDNFCTVQRVERDANGEVIAFGNIIEFFADAGSAESTRITGNVTADGRVMLRTAPTDNAPTLRSIDLSGGVTAGVVGDATVDAAGATWVRLTEGRDPLTPAGWARAENLRAAPVADRVGPLPRLTTNPAELVPFIGERHGDPWDALAELLGIDAIRAGSGSGVVEVDQNGEPTVALARFVREYGAVYDLILSDRLDDGTWQIRETMRLQIGTDQVVISPGTGRCPWLGGDANEALVVVDLDKDGVAAWEWHDEGFVSIDASGIRCDRQDRG